MPASPLRSWRARRRVAAVLAAIAATATSLVLVAGPSPAAAGSVVGTASTADGSGWWTVDRVGDVTAAGTARSYGSLSAMHRRSPVVGMTATPDGLGYWLVASNGGVFSFGDAHFFGSTGNLRLNKPVVGMAPTADGRGYWLVASDGGVFAFGDAHFYRATGSLRLSKPIVGLAATSDSSGYWLVAADGGIFTFGNARFFGSTGRQRLSSPIVGIAPTADKAGYWLVGATGTVSAFGDATLAGSPVPGSTSFGIVATPGGGYTVFTTVGPQHFGPPGTTQAGGAPPSQTPSGTPPPTPPTAAGGGSAKPGGSSPGDATSQPVTPAPTNETGLTSTIGTSTTPQVVRRGTSLRQVNPSDPTRYLPGTFKFFGVDSYELSTDWDQLTYGCGNDVSNGDMTALFHALGPDAVVRVWFFQAMATNKYNGTINWAGLDRVVNLANQSGVHLIATLGNEDGTCDDSGWKDPSWYQSGYQQTIPGQTFSYSAWAQQVAKHYAGSPAILAYEPINEPRPDTCTDASNCWSNRICPSDQVANAALRGFYDVIGAEIRAADPNHLISDGAPAYPGCGTNTWADMTNLEASPGIDLMSFHDYSRWARRADADVAGWKEVSAAVDKPLFAGENGGINATGDKYPNPSCPDQTGRAATFSGQAADEFARMSFFTGWLFWNASGSNVQTCDFETWMGDPLLTSLATVAARARAAS